ncbi:YkgJ family cysteine cluster protein [Gammaproteobacteria bacterium]
MMTERRFHCTACGKCCHGWLPLTLNDAITHAARFPLALVWTPVPQATKAFDLAVCLGSKIRLGNRKKIAVFISLTAYIPTSFPCPALTAQGLCSIHDIKPIRCRTMPFYPYREEQDQADMLIPRKNWECDISLAAPIVYRERKILDRDYFGQERTELLQQTPIMRSYAEYMLKYAPGIVDNLASVATGSGGNIVTSLSSFLTATRKIDASRLAEKQQIIFDEYATKTAINPQLIEYHRNYAGWSKEMNYLSKH